MRDVAGRHHVGGSSMYDHGLRARSGSKMYWYQRLRRLEAAVASFSALAMRNGMWKKISR